jgi:hypothetical protein
MGSILGSEASPFFWQAPASVSVPSKITNFDRFDFDGFIAKTSSARVG